MSKTGAHAFPSGGTETRNIREPVSIITGTTKDYFETKSKDIRITNLNRVIIFHINRNSARKKLELLAEGIMGNENILMITEKKKLMNLFQQAYLLHLILLNHITFTELKMEEGYLSTLWKIFILNF